MSESFGVEVGNLYTPYEFKLAIRTATSDSIIS